MKVTEDERENLAGQGIVLELAQWPIVVPEVARSHLSKSEACSKPPWLWALQKLDGFHELLSAAQPSLYVGYRPRRGHTMDDDEIIQRLRDVARESSAVAVALALDQLAPGGLTHGSLIAYFKRAFPEIPLRTLLVQAPLWHRITSGPVSDAEFDELLQPWLPRKQQVHRSSPMSLPLIRAQPSSA